MTIRHRYTPPSIRDIAANSTLYDAMFTESYNREKLRVGDMIRIIANNNNHRWAEGQVVYVTWIGNTRNGQRIHTCDKWIPEPTEGGNGQIYDRDGQVIYTRWWVLRGDCILVGHRNTGGAGVS